MKRIIRGKLKLHAKSHPEPELKTYLTRIAEASFDIRPIPKAEEPEEPEKPITWQEAVKVLHDFCEKQPRCVECPAQNWCESNGFYGRETFLPYQWEMPSEEE